MAQERRRTRRDSGGKEGRMGRIVVRRVGGMQKFLLLGEKNQKVGFW